ncbi:TcaA NTF2-like domain-containing protein [Ectobacillus ponti]|uniref:C2H2-type domain-containing protein n=1 Tax=Ectobacillus ponti TaxID=2961894 RepID=A0AA42BR67_9BACI|nr:hypothetical protein [Ectobacillus ponti]MCP8970632.1 hypothetical protein [Ectobacillus ponti]
MKLCQACGREMPAATNSCAHCGHSHSALRERPAGKLNNRKSEGVDYTREKASLPPKEKGTPSLQHTEKEKKSFPRETKGQAQQREEEEKEKTKQGRANGPKQVRPGQTKAGGSKQPKPANAGKTQAVSAQVTPSRAQVRKKPIRRRLGVLLLVVLAGAGIGGYYYAKDEPVSSQGNARQTAAEQHASPTGETAASSTGVTVEQMQRYMDKYLQAGLLAYNNRDMGPVKQYIEPNSKLMKDTVDYLVVLNKRGIYEELLNCEVMHVEDLGGQVYNVTVSSQYNISFNHGETRRFQSYRVVYQVVKKGDSFVTRAILKEDMIEKREL